MASKGEDKTICCAPTAPAQLQEAAGMGPFPACSRQGWESWSPKDLAMPVPPLLDPRRRWAELTSEENTTRLDGIWRSHYSRLAWDMTLRSPGTVLSSLLLPGVASLVSATKGALLVTSQHGVQSEQRKSPPHPRETLTSRAWALNCPPAYPADEATILTCLGSMASNCLLLRRDHQRVGWDREDALTPLKRDALRGFHWAVPLKSHCGSPPVTGS